MENDEALNARYRGFSRALEAHLKTISTDRGRMMDAAKEVGQEQQKRKTQLNNAGAKAGRRLLEGSENGVNPFESLQFGPLVDAVREAHQRPANAEL